MPDPLRGLMRMTLWARRRPSETRVKLVLAVIGLCLALAAVEHFIGWPEALTVERLRAR